MKRHRDRCRVLQHPDLHDALRADGMKTPNCVAARRVFIARSAWRATWNEGGEDAMAWFPIVLTGTA
jgi:hypothetical protein